LVIILGFSLDVALRGAIEEAASLIIVLRLWRVFQIIEELTAGAQEEIDDLSEKIAELEGEYERLKQGGRSARRELEGENGKLKREVEELRKRVQYEERKNGESSRKQVQETPPTPD
jgi:Skp family chaperone for outer membrane proteins